MKILAFFTFLPLFVFSQELPLKPFNEFEIKLDYKFKQRPTESSTTVHLNETAGERARRSSTDQLPYLKLNVSMLQFNSGETRYMVASNFSEKLAGKKVEVGSTLTLDLGFTDDVKDRVTAHEYYVTFLDASKKPINKIVIFVDRDGTFLVNGEKRGKF
jgi:hypothetical protein